MLRIFPHFSKLYLEVLGLQQKNSHGGLVIVEDRSRIRQECGRGRKLHPRILGECGYLAPLPTLAQ